MAKCKYILQLPGGEQIELPSSFNTLEQSKDIDKLFFNFITRTDESKKADLISELSELIKSRVPSEIHGNTINNIIKSSKEVSEVYEKINTIIYSLGTYENIDKAIRNYVQSESKKTSKTGKRKSSKDILSELKTKLNKPRNKKYFEEFGLTGVLGATSLRQERDRIRSKNLENKEFGFPTQVTENLENFLKAIFYRDIDLRDSNLFYGTNNSIIGKAWSSDNLIMYELNDDLSLFLGLFKREAVKVDPALLLPILERINKIVKFKKYGQIDINLDTFDINEFFLGKIENNKIKESIFETLLTKAENKDIAKELDSILALVANTINPKSTDLTKSLKNLFWQIAPDSYGKNNLFKQLEDLKIVSEETVKEKEYKNSLLSFNEMDKDVRHAYFSLPDVIVDDVYNNAIKNLTLNKDIVKFPVNEYGVYALVTHIFERGDKVSVYGIYKNQFGTLETVKHTFGPGELVYRKREAAIDPYDPDEIIVKANGALVSSPTPMSQKLVKQLIQKGDIVNGNLVVGIYPGYLYLERPDKTKETNYYSHIRTVSSAKALALLEEEKNVVPSKFIQINGEDLTAGDYFLSVGKDGKKSYKKVLYTDKDNVYALVIGTKDNAITANKRIGLVGLKNANGELNAAEVAKIRDESGVIGSSKATMSSFMNNNAAKPGDYFTFTENGIKKYGKVLEEEKVIINDGTLSNRIVQSLNSLPQVQFFTNRDISSNYAFFTIRANSYALEFKDEAEPLDVEMRYVVPKGTDISNIKMLTNGYANIGTYKAVDSVNPEEDIDITDSILKILDKSSLKVFGKKVSSTNKYERNLESLTEIKYFDKLDAITKMNLNVLTPGTYFSLYKESTIDRNIYRINSVSNGIIRAQLNKMSSDGRIITNEVELPIEQLLASRSEGAESSPIGSIGKLYIMNGNNKMGAVIREVNKLSKNTVIDNSTLRPATNKAINKLIKNLKTYIKDLKVNIKLVPGTENFQPGQKAKIETTEDGKTSILINDEIGQTEDVVHEFLHLFLTPLRYRHPEIYNQLINSVVKDQTLNVTDAEEEFVKFVSGKMESQEDFLENFADLQAFVKGLQTILTDVDLAYDISSEDNPITLLNTPLMDLFDIDKTDNSNPLYNLGMITTEPMMREWMKNNNIVLNCI